jgi:hypothetical protein
MGGGIRAALIITVAQANRLARGSKKWDVPGTFPHLLPLILG